MTIRRGWPTIQSRSTTTPPSFSPPIIQHTLPIKSKSRAAVTCPITTSQTEASSREKLNTAKTMSPAKSLLTDPSSSLDTLQITPNSKVRRPTTDNTRPNTSTKDHHPVPMSTSPATFRSRVRLLTRASTSLTESNHSGLTQATSTRQGTLPLLANRGTTKNTCPTKSMRRRCVQLSCCQAVPKGALQASSTCTSAQPETDGNDLPSLFLLQIQILNSYINPWVIIKS